jgi:hypothetical protein
MEYFSSFNGPSLETNIIILIMYTPLSMILALIFYSLHPTYFFYHLHLSSASHRTFQNLRSLVFKISREDTFNSCFYMLQHSMSVYETVHIGCLGFYKSRFLIKMYWICYSGFVVLFHSEQKTFSDWSFQRTKLRRSSFVFTWWTYRSRLDLRFSRHWLRKFHFLL